MDRIRRMSAPLLLVTGFGPFEEVEENPSARIVERLDADPPADVELAVRILPVSFRRSTSGLESALKALEPRRPDAILSLGVHTKSKSFRIERHATTTLKNGRPDVLGVEADSLRLPKDKRLSSTLDLEALREALEQSGSPSAELSENAGGYVCERLYYSALKRAEKLGVPAVFLHVPPLEQIKFEAQVRSVRQFLTALARQISL